MTFILSRILALTGLRFSKDYRWGTTLYHRLVYRVVDTVGCNLAADRLVNHDLR